MILKKIETLITARTTHYFISNISNNYYYTRIRLTRNTCLLKAAIARPSSHDLPQPPLRAVHTHTRLTTQLFFMPSYALFTPLDLKTRFSVHSHVLLRYATTTSSRCVETAPPVLSSTRVDLRTAYCAISILLCHESVLNTSPVILRNCTFAYLHTPYSHHLFAAFTRPLHNSCKCSLTSY